MSDELTNKQVVDTIIKVIQEGVVKRLDDLNGTVRSNEYAQ